MGRLIDTATGRILRVAQPRAKSWWPRPESNQRHTDFQSAALPTELLGLWGTSSDPECPERSANYTREPVVSPRNGHCLSAAETLLRPNQTLSRTIWRTSCQPFAIN